MNKRLLLVLILLGIVFGACSTLLASDDDDDDDEYGGSMLTQAVPAGGGDTAMYQKDCGECHFAYQPGLLPAKSWRMLMTDSQLADHFGEELEYSPQTKSSLLAYLTANSADVSRGELSRKMMRSVGNSGQFKISETRYIKNEHDEIPAKMITGNKDVNTLGNCSACHQDAAQGGYSEDRVSIPNYPGYED